MLFLLNLVKHLLPKLKAGVIQFACLSGFPAHCVWPILVRIQ
jgi:hypothetical protein